jgi:hypothetical protein
VLIEIAAAHGLEAEVLATLERFAEVAPALVDALDGRDWPPGQRGYVLSPPSTVGGRAYTWSVDCGDSIALAPIGCLSARRDGWRQVSTACIGMDRHADAGA